jgi:hypothetical protein
MTIHSIEYRWNQHCVESSRNRAKNRPLYNAINKYGIENFSISEIEYVDDENKLIDREKYWIEFFGSFKYGYNATLGGDGKSYLDYDLIIKTYLQVKNIKEVARILNIDAGHISTILKTKEITILSAGQISGIQVAMLNHDGQIEKVFPTLSDAAKYLIEIKLASGVISSIRTHIKEVADGKRVNAYKHKWKLI